MKNIIYAALDILMTLVSWILVNWWAPLFAYQGPVTSGGVTRIGYRLPDWLAWFDTFDDDLDSGARRDGVEPSYFKRMAWLYRNPAYGFSYWALGIPFNPVDWKIIECTGIPHTEGFKFRAESLDGKYYNEMTVQDGICRKTGYKAWNMFDYWGTKQWRTVAWGPQWRIPFVYSVTRA